MDKISIDLVLMECEGDWYDHGTQDLLVATFHDKESANVVCEMLNVKYKDWKTEDD